MQVGEIQAAEHQGLRQEVAQLQTVIAGLAEVLDRSGGKRPVAEQDGRPVSPLKAFIIRRHLATLRERVDALDACVVDILAQPPRPKSAPWVGADSPRRLGARDLRSRVTPPEAPKRRPGMRAKVLLGLLIAGIAIGGSFGVRALTAAPAPTRAFRVMTERDQRSAASWSAKPVEVSPRNDVQADASNVHGWRINGTEAANDGSDFGDQNWQNGLWNLHWVDMPVQPVDGITSYSVEATIRIVSRPTCGSFGLVARAYQAGVHLCSEYGRPVFSIRSSAPELLIAVPFEIDEDWHHFRLELHEGALRALIDGIVVSQLEDGVVPAGGRVGLWDDHTPLAVRDFRVLDLTQADHPEVLQ